MVGWLGAKPLVEITRDARLPEQTSALAILTMKALTAGAGGFIDQELALALLTDTSCSQIALTDLTEPPILDGVVEHATTLSSVSADLLEE